MAPDLPTKSLACALVALALAAHARAAPAPALARWGSLPVSFEPNRGQAPPSVDFITRSRDGAGFLAGGALTLRLDRCTRTRGCRTRAVRMRLAGARPGKPEALEPLPGITSYFLGKDPSRWIAGIPTYGQVLYREVMPGVDLRYHGSERHLELDMVLAPSADPGRLRLAFDGADRVSVDPKGDLQLTAGDQSVTLRRPVAYQEIAGERRPVTAEYAVNGGRAVAIALGERDRSRPVVVDPVLVYSSQLGGTSDDVLEAIAVDSSGAAYAAGNAWNGFPTVGGIQGYGGASDVVVLKLDPSGTTLVYSVYLGGAFSDHAYGIAVDGSGNVVIAGETLSADYPVVNAIQNTWGGGSSEGFVTKLGAAGNSLVYSTYAGGGQSDNAAAVAVDGSGNAYITGGTQSSNWVVTSNAYQAAKAGNRDAFVLKLSPSGTRLYSTYLGGQQEDYGQGIAVDGAGNMFVAGVTSSGDFPTANAYQATNNGGSDAFVTKLSAGGNTLLFSTYLGGASNDTAEGLALHLATGGAVVAGGTFSNNFPTTTGAYDISFNGGEEAFAAELSSTGALTFSTYLGGSGDDAALAVAQGLTGGPWVAGSTASLDFPTPGSPYQGTGGGATDVFVAHLEAGGGALLYATYLGGTGNDRALGVAVDGAGGTYVVGESGAAFPTTSGAYQNPATPLDAFAAKLRDPFSLSAVNPAQGPTGGGTQVTLTGAGFTPNLLATFGGDASVPATYAGPTTLVARTPPHAEGPVDVQVVSLDGTKSNLLPGAFTYVPGPAVDGGDDGGVPDGGETDGGVPGRPLDLLGCSCQVGASSSTALAFALLAAIAARARQRRKPTSAPASQ